jgi:DDE superfamily endonuclease
MEKPSAASTSNHALQRLHATESRGALPKTNGRLRSCRRRCEDLCFPAAPGRKARHDYEYERNGVAHLFMMFAPLEGWRHVKVTDRHAAVDYAHVLKDLSDTHFPNAAKIVLVQDNLSTHTRASLYAAFPRRSATAERAVRMALHAKARQLARHGGVRTRRARNPMPGSSHSQQVGAHRGGRRLAEQSQQASRQGRLAIHDP